MISYYRDFAWKKLWNIVTLRASIPRKRVTHQVRDVKATLPLPIYASAPETRNNDKFQIIIEDENGDLLQVVEVDVPATIMNSNDNQSEDDNIDIEMNIIPIPKITYVVPAESMDSPELSIVIEGAMGGTVKVVDIGKTVNKVHR